MDLTLFGIHLSVDWGGIGFIHPYFQFHVGSLWFVVILVALALLRRVGREKGLWLQFWDGGVKGTQCIYQLAPRLVERLGRIKKHPVVVVVPVSGPILDEGYAQHKQKPWEDNPVFGIELGNTLKRLSTVKQLAGVFVHMNTPGGTIIGSRALFEGLQACKDAEKPVVCYVGGLSASGGMWAMMGASKIIADPQAILGSVGVIGPSLMHFEDVTALKPGLLGTGVEAARITSHTLHEGRGKDLGDPFTTPDPVAERSLQDVLHQTYEAFIAHIAGRRAITTETLRELGAVVFGAQKALQLGLIDEIGDRESAQRSLATQLTVAWKDCQLVILGPLPRKVSLLFGDTSEHQEVHTKNFVQAQLRRHLALVISPLWRH